MEMEDEAPQPFPTFTEMGTLPYHIKQQVLYKMANRELSRMRRTCSSINKLIELKNEQLASRVRVGRDLKIDTNGKLRLCRDCGFDDRLCSKHSMVAISVSRLSMELTEKGDLPRIAETLRERQFVCDSAVISCQIVNDVVLEILNLINTRFSIDLYLDYGSVQTPSRQLEIFAQLNMGRNRSKLHIYASRFELPVHGVFDLFTNFCSFECGHFSPEIFHRFLQDLYQSKGNTNLTKVWCIFGNQKESPFENSAIEFPAMETLFDRSTFKFPIEISTEACMTIKIRKMELGNDKCVILMEKNYHYQNELHIVENDDRRIAELIAETLKIQRDFEVGKYVSSGKEDRFQLLQRTYIERTVAEERRSRRSQPEKLLEFLSSDEEEYDDYYDYYYENEMDV